MKLKNINKINMWYIAFNNFSISLTIKILASLKKTKNNTADCSETDKKNTIALG